VILYHYTDQTSLAAILVQGLVPKGGEIGMLDGRPVVWLTLASENYIVTHPLSGEPTNWLEGRNVRLTVEIRSNDHRLTPWPHWAGRHRSETLEASRQGPTLARAMEESYFYEGVIPASAIKSSLVIELVPRSKPRDAA
jgi:hypothetical protein